MESIRIGSHNNTDLNFNWRKMMEEGMKRRRSLDINLKSHKIKFHPTPATTTINNDEDDYNVSDIESKSTTSTDHNHR